MPLYDEKQLTMAGRLARATDDFIHQLMYFDAKAYPDAAALMEDVEELSKLIDNYTVRDAALTFLIQHPNRDSPFYLEECEDETINKFLRNCDGIDMYNFLVQPDILKAFKQLNDYGKVDNKGKIREKFKAFIERIAASDW